MFPGLVKEGIEKEAVVVETGKEFFCNTCDKTYSSKNILKNHIQSCHGIAKERITKVCGKLFLSCKYIRHHKWEIYTDHCFKCVLSEKILDDFCTSGKT